MTPSRTFLFTCLSFIGGIAIASFLPFARYLWPVLIVLAIGIIAVCWRYRHMALLGFCILVMGLGVLRYARFYNTSPHDVFLTKVSRQIIFEGKIVGDPQDRRKNQHLVIESNNVHGKVLVEVSPWIDYQYGDILRLDGTIEIPQDIGTFRYQEHLAKDSIFWFMRNPKIEILERGGGNKIWHTLFFIKRKMQEQVSHSIASPQAELVQALLFGEQRLLSDEFLEKLNRTGLRHIIAISGMNVSIIAMMVMSAMIFFGLWRSYAFYATCIFLVVFVAMIGMPPSAVRAGIMGGFFLLAQHIGRISSATRAVVFASTFMLAFNPMLLRFDIGFQLSFAAILGIIFFSPYFYEKLHRIANPHLFPLRTVLSMTLGAQVATLPILVLHFDIVSIVTPLTNILVVPTTSPLIMLGILFSIIAFLSPLVASPIAWLLWLGTGYIIFVTELFGAISFASIELYNTVIRVIFLCGALGALLLLWRAVQMDRDHKRKLFQIGM